LVTFIILYNVHFRLADRLRKGDVLLGYLILYPLGRFFIEFFRPDAWTIGQLATAQWIAIILVVGSSIVLALRHIFWDRDKPGAEPPEEPAPEGAVAA
jgi:phosphatidylglycerol:prolipoprotein diacylglycerol transferase